MMKKIFLLFWIALPLPTLGATVYISDELRVPMRSSPCGTCAIVHRGLIAGTALNVLGTKDGWTQATTSSGLSGWVPDQYLVSQPIAKTRLVRIEAAYETLKAENTQLKEQMATLQATKSEIESSQEDIAAEKQALEQELATIKKVSSNALMLQEQNEELVKRNRILQSDLDVLTATRDQLVSDKSQKWFFYGCLAVFLGAILAILLPRLKPRRSFSEWA